MQARHLPGLGTASTDLGETAARSAAERGQPFYHPDHLGSTEWVTDRAGELYEHVQYFPYGDVWVNEHENVERLPYLFTGKELDEETGLYYFGARYYDPQTSVWQSTDPALAAVMTASQEQSYDATAGAVTSSDLFAFDGAAFNLYGYVGGAPLTRVDPNGLIPPNDMVATDRAIGVKDANETWKSAAFQSGLLGSVAGAIRIAAMFARGPLASLLSMEGDTSRPEAPPTHVLSEENLPPPMAMLPPGGLPNSPAPTATSTGTPPPRNTASKVGSLDKPPRGPGSVPPAQRDPKRLWTPGERERKRAAQGGECATGCGTPIDASNSRGHHKQRHADGGRTNDANHAEVCEDCHLDLHAPDD